jgi:hypothetical protein
MAADSVLATAAAQLAAVMAADGVLATVVTTADGTQVTKAAGVDQAGMTVGTTILTGTHTGGTLVTAFCRSHG